MSTALSVYYAFAASTTLTTANKLYTGTGGSPTTAQNLTSINASTGYGEIPAQGSAAAWAASGSIGTPTGKGFFLDATTLDGQDIISGNFSGIFRINTQTTGTVTADIYIRVHRYHPGTTTYTQIVSMVLTGQSIVNTITSFSLPSTSTGSNTSFATGDKLYVDCWLNITTNTSSAGQQIKHNRQSLDTTTFVGDTQAVVVTPGYQTSSSVTINNMNSVDSLSVTDQAIVISTIAIFVENLVSTDISSLAWMLVNTDTLSTVDSALFPIISLLVENRSISDTTSLETDYYAKIELLTLVDSLSTALVMTTTYSFIESLVVYETKGSYSLIILGDSPRAYYRLNEASGTVAYDASVNGNNAKLSGTITYTQTGLILGDADTSLLFDGLTGVLTLPTTLNYTTWSAFSFEYWTNVEGVTQHIVVTCNGPTTLVYVNGAVSVPGTTALIEISSIFSFIGSYTTCQLDEVAVYDYVLAPDKVANHTNFLVIPASALSMQYGSSDSLISNDSFSENLLVQGSDLLLANDLSTRITSTVLIEVNTVTDLFLFTNAIVASDTLAYNENANGIDTYISSEGLSINDILVSTSTNSIVFIDTVQTSDSASFLLLENVAELLVNTEITLQNSSLLLLDILVISDISAFQTVSLDGLISSDLSISTHITIFIESNSIAENTSATNSYFIFEGNVLSDIYISIFLPILSNILPVIDAKLVINTYIIFKQLSFSHIFITSSIFILTMASINIVPISNSTLKIYTIVAKKNILYYREYLLSRKYSFVKGVPITEIFISISSSLFLETTILLKTSSITSFFFVSDGMNCFDFLSIFFGNTLGGSDTIAVIDTLLFTTLSLTVEVVSSSDVIGIQTNILDTLIGNDLLTLQTVVTATELLLVNDVTLGNEIVFFIETNTIGDVQSFVSIVPFVELLFGIDRESSIVLFAISDGVTINDSSVTNSINQNIESLFVSDILVVISISLFNEILIFSDVLLVSLALVFSENELLGELNASQILSLTSLFYFENNLAIDQILFGTTFLSLENTFSIDISISTFSFFISEILTLIDNEMINENVQERELLTSSETLLANDTISLIDGTVVNDLFVYGNVFTNTDGVSLSESTLYASITLFSEITNIYDGYLVIIQYGQIENIFSIDIFTTYGVVNIFVVFLEILFLSDVSISFSSFVIPVTIITRRLIATSGKRVLSSS